MPTRDETIARLAEALIAARSGGAKVVPDADMAALSLEDAYPVQARVAQAIGPVGGFKVACKPGQPVILAPIFCADIQHAPGRIAASEPVGIELEFGFVITGPLPDADAPDHDAALADAVSLVPVIELVQTRLAENLAEGNATPALTLADNQINGGLIVGEPLADWRHLDLTGAAARLRFGGTDFLNGRAEVPGGNAFDNLRALVAHAGTHCGGLKEGDVVITGSLNGLPYVPPGTDISARIEGLGALTADFPK